MEMRVLLSDSGGRSRGRAEPEGWMAPKPAGGPPGSQTPVVTASVHACVAVSVRVRTTVPTAALPASSAALGLPPPVRPPHPWSPPQATPAAQGSGADETALFVLNGEAPPERPPRVSVARRAAQSGSQPGEEQRRCVVHESMNALKNLFSKPPEPKELVRKWQNTCRGEGRAIDRQIRGTPLFSCVGRLGPPVRTTRDVPDRRPVLRRDGGERFARLLRRQPFLPRHGGIHASFARRCGPIPSATNGAGTRCDVPRVLAAVITPPVGLQVRSWDPVRVSRLVSEAGVVAGASLLCVGWIYRGSGRISWCCAIPT